MSRKVWTIMSNIFGEPRLLGVYEDYKAADVAINHLADKADTNDEFRIKLVTVSTEEEEKKALDSYMFPHSEVTYEAVSTANPIDLSLD